MKLTIALVLSLSVVAQADQPVAQVTNTMGNLPEGVLVSFPGPPRLAGSRFLLSFSPDDETLAAGGPEGTVRLWAVATGTLKMVLRSQAEVSSLSFSPDGSTLASGGGDGVVRVWTVGNGALRDSLDVGGWGDSMSGHSVTAVSFSPDGRTLAGAQGTRIQFWDVDTGTRGLALEGGTHRNEDDSISEQEVFTSFSFSPDGSTLVSGSYYDGGGWVVCCGLLSLWDVRTGKRRDVLPHWLHVASVAFSPDGSVIAIDGQESCNDARIFCPWSVQLRDVATGALVGSSGGTAFSPDGTLLAGGRFPLDGQFAVGLWDVATGTRQATLEGHTDWILSVSFSPDGQTLASAGADGMVFLWDVSQHTIPMAVSTDGQVVAGPSAQAMLLPNYPNPFNLQTSIPFQLHQAFAQVRLNIYDARGALVRAFDLGSRPAGLYRAVWDGRDQLGKHVASGVYMSRLQAATVFEHRKMLLAK